MIVHSTARISQISGIPRNPYFLAGIHLAYHLPAERSAVVVDHHHPDIAHHFGVIDERVKHRIYQRKKKEKEDDATVMDDVGELTPVFRHKITEMAFYIFPHGGHVLIIIRAHIPGAACCA